MPSTKTPRRRSTARSASRTGAIAAPRAESAAQQQLFERWLLEITALPTAAGKESRVIAWIERWARERSKDIDLTRDAHGNLYLRRKRTRPNVAPVFITAHLDHPAFVVREIRGRDLTLEFRGGVHDPYFDRAKLEVLDADERSHAATITALDAGAKPFKLATARLSKAATSIRVGDIARWKLPTPRIAKGLIRTHGCDDLAAVAAALSAFERIRAIAGCEHVGLLFTRSEEIGFIGAIGAARSRSIPRNARLICLENSRSFAESPIGGGPIVRVGDRITVFTPELTNRIAAIMGEYQKTAPSYRWQRKLMPGGACEASAFACYGYASTCLCLPLGNYHNMQDIDGVLAGKRPAKVGSEYVSVNDYHGLITMLEVVAKELDALNVPPLIDRMESLWREHEGVLK
jgi:putative aminopeptidase FrvX